MSLLTAGGGLDWSSFGIVFAALPLTVAAAWVAGRRWRQ